MNRKDFFKKTILGAFAIWKSPEILEASKGYLDNFKEITRTSYGMGIEQRLRIYAHDKDVFRFWALRELQPESILNVIKEKFGEIPIPEEGWKFKYHEDEIDESLSL